jgi:hypothetical protein
LWTGVGAVTWGIAGAVHDTRQAKRLFPLYGSGLILGGAVGGFVTAPLAAALGAEKAIFLTDIAGLLTDVDDPASLVSRIDAAELDAMIESGQLSGGMIPKVVAAADAVRRGVGSAHLLDGRIPHVLLLELFSDEGIGTMVTSGDLELGMSTSQEPRNALDAAWGGGGVVGRGVGA